MDALATFGSIVASEGANTMAILAPAELPPGHVSWTSRETSTTDNAFANTTAPTLLTAWLTAGACAVAWKEATFDSVNHKKNDEPEDDAS
jgi:hypothetical protein